MTTAEQMNELTREAAQRFATTAEAEGAYDADMPPQAGQVRMITGQIADSRPIDVNTGKLEAARPLTDFRIERHTGSRWVDDAILPQPLQISWQLSDHIVVEPATGTVVTEVFIKLNRPAGTTGVTVYISTADGTATAPDDYVAKTREAVQFAQGETLKQVDFTINASPVEDPRETFTCAIVDASEGTWGATNSPTFRADTLTIAILTSLAPFTISVADASVTEGDKAELTITAARAVPQAVTGNWSAAAPQNVASVLRAVEGTNYQVPTRTERNWTIAAGRASTVFEIETLNTAAIQPSLLLDVSLTDLASPGAPIATSGNDLTARLTINDTTPATTGVRIGMGASIGSIGGGSTRRQGSTGGGQIVGGSATHGLTPTLNKASNVPVLFDWAFIIGYSTANPGSVVVYYVLSGTAIFAAGTTTNPQPFHRTAYIRGGTAPPSDSTIVGSSYSSSLRRATGTTRTAAAFRAENPTKNRFHDLATRYVYRWYGNPVNATIGT